MAFLQQAFQRHFLEKQQVLEVLRFQGRYQWYSKRRLLLCWWPPFVWPNHLDLQLLQTSGYADMGVELKHAHLLWFTLGWIVHLQVPMIYEWWSFAGMAYFLRFSRPCSAITHISLALLIIGYDVFGVRIILGVLWHFFWGFSRQRHQAKKNGWAFNPQILLRLKLKPCNHLHTI